MVMLSRLDLTPESMIHLVKLTSSSPYDIHCSEYYLVYDRWYHAKGVVVLKWWIMHHNIVQRGWWQVDSG